MNAHTWEERLLHHLSPEQRLGVALFAQVLRDARHRDYGSPVWTPPKSSWQGKENTCFHDARTWLLTQQAEVVWWLDLLGLPEGTYGHLLTAAGLVREETIYDR